MIDSLDVVNPRPGVLLKVRSDDDANVVTEVFDWNVYQIGPRVAGRIVVDCGAHIGSLSVLCASLGARAVYAIEPHPDNLAVLRENVKDWPRIKVIEAAVGATSGTTIIAGESGTAFTVGATLDDEHASTVRQVTLAELMTEYRLKRIDLLKADCEGGEMNMLLAADLRRVMRIAMEWHGTIFHRGQSVPSIGQLVEHLLKTHEVNVGGTPDQWGQLHALRYETA